MRFLRPAFANPLNILLVWAFALSCTFTTTRSKNPIFSTNLDTLSLNLKSLIDCENIEFQGTEKKTGNQTISELTVNLINGKNVPGDQVKLNKLGKDVASLLKKALKNPDDFDIYKILFVTQEINGAVKNSKYTGHIYKKEDL